MIQKMQFDIEIKILDLLDNIEKNKRNVRFFYKLEQLLYPCQDLVKLDLSGFPGGSVVKNLPASAGYTGLIPGIGRSSGERNGNPFQYPCLEKSWIEEPGGL